MIPTKIVIIGDVDVGQMYIGIAKTQLAILEGLMKYQNLNEGHRTVKFHNKVVVECYSSFGFHEVRIHVTGVEGYREGVEVSRKKQKCFCACHVATGYIINHRHACYDFTNLDKMYDVLVCKHKRYYVLLQNMRSLGFTPYKNNEKVLLVYQPEVGHEYIPFKGQGCSMVHCRISNIKETHRRFYEDFS
jgi:hypothetical protein